MSLGQIIDCNGAPHRVLEVTQHWTIIDGVPYRDVHALRLTDGTRRVLAVLDPWERAA